MKIIVAIAAGLLITASAVDAAPRSTVEHFPSPPRPDGSASPFSSAVRVGDVLYLSGQIGVGTDGKLPDGIDPQTKQAMENIGAVLKRARLGFGDVFHCTAFLSDMKNWPAFNAIYVPYFPAGKLPARSALGANGLALNALVELECQAYAGPK